VPPIDPARRADMVRLLELGWRPDAVAEQLHVSRATVYNTERNLMRYGQPIRPRVRKAGRPAALTKANREALLELLLHDGWKYLDEI
jgi:transposase